jgi:hypothetical protein
MKRFGDSRSVPAIFMVSVLLYRRAQLRPDRASLNESVVESEYIEWTGRNMYRLQAAGLTTIALVSLLTSCSKNSASDDTLANDVKAKLYSDATTKPAAINVAVNSGVVTLSGDVPSSDVELQALKVANGTPGVRSVNDQLKVNSAMTQLPDAGTPQTQPPPKNPYNGTPATAGSQNPAAPSAPPPSPSSSTTPAVASTPPPWQAAPEAEPPKPVEFTIAAGTPVSVRMIDSIDSKTADAGQVFRASLSEPLVSHGRTVVPAGTPVSVLLAQERDAGRIKGQASLEVRLASIDYHGKSYKVESSAVTEEGKARGKSTAVRTGIGAAAGAVIGALAGGGKGAAIGSAAGGGAGFGVNVFTHGQQVKIPSETVLNFSLQAPLTIEKGR